MYWKSAMCSSCTGQLQIFWFLSTVELGGLDFNNPITIQWFMNRTVRPDALIHWLKKDLADEFSDRRNAIPFQIVDCRILISNSSSLKWNWWNTAWGKLENLREVKVIINKRTFLFLKRLPPERAFNIAFSFESLKPIVFSWELTQITLIVCWSCKVLWETYIVWYIQQIGHMSKWVEFLLFKHVSRSSILTIIDLSWRWPLDIKDDPGVRNFCKREYRFA